MKLVTLIVIFLVVQCVFGEKGPGQALYGDDETTKLAEQQGATEENGPEVQRRINDSPKKCDTGYDANGNCVPKEEVFH
ncbi:hypothetical protein QE152_g15307 [Popillia japonica]|uniref:Uncharacterized protein n=1 Tax=Popillia japonica TaxID=7064 RepID=A0AAW1L6B3_POPJA